MTCWSSRDCGVRIFDCGEIRNPKSTKGSTFINEKSSFQKCKEFFDLRHRVEKKVSL